MIDYLITTNEPTNGILFFSLLFLYKYYNPA